MIRKTNSTRFVRKDPRVKKILIPGKFFDMREERNPTRYKMDPKTGRMVGRYQQVPLEYSDRIKYLMMKYDADVTGDKIPDLFKGQIIGRIPKNIVNKPAKIIIKLKLKPGQRLKKRARPTITQTRGAYHVYKK